MDGELERFFPSGCFLFQFLGLPCLRSGGGGQGRQSLAGPSVLRDDCLVPVQVSPLPLLRYPVCLPRAPALRQVLVAMLAEGTLESPSVLVLAFHSSLFLVEGSSDGSAPGDRFLSLGGCVHSRRFGWDQSLRRCLYWGVGFSSSSDLSVFCRIQWHLSSRKLLGVPVRVGSSSSLHGWVLFDFVPVLSWVFSPGFGRGPPSSGCDCTGLVAWSLLAPRSWKPPCQFTPFARSIVLWRWCGWTTVSPLFPHLVRCTLAYGLTVSRPWTGLCWSHLLSLGSGGSVRGYTAPVGWLRGVFPCFAYCPTSSVLKRSSFGFSASSFAMGSPFRVESVSVLDRNEGSSWCLVRVFAMGSPCRVGVCPRSWSERRLFAHLPWWLVSSLRDGVTHFGSGGAFLRPRSERRLLPFIYP